MKPWKLSAGDWLCFPARFAGRVLGVGQCSADDLYRALDWLHEAQGTIERRLARQHLAGATLVLYDLTSTWLTGRCCELAARGHSRDGKQGDPPPRQNSCRPDRTSNPGAAMKDASGSIRTSIQGQSGGQAVAAGERSGGSRCA